MKVYFTEDAEIHLMDGGYAAVKWNMREMRKRATDEDGVVHIVRALVRDGDPFVTFPVMGEYKGSDGETVHYEREDTTVEGGLSLAAARILAKDLAQAIGCLEQLGVS